MSIPTIIPPYLVTSRKFSKDPELLETILGKMYFDVASAVNYREIAIYDRFEVTTGQQWYNDTNIQKRRQAFRQIYTLASIANGLNTIPTGLTITTQTQFTHIYATADSTTNNLSVPIPYVNVTVPGDDIEIRVNRATANIEITTSTANWTTYNAVIVLEYILNK